jgi:hypothetical protein
MDIERILGIRAQIGHSKRLFKEEVIHFIRKGKRGSMEVTMVKKRKPEESKPDSRPAIVPEMEPGQASQGEIPTSIPNKK